MLDEPKLGRLTVWCVHGGSDAVQLQIDLDHDQAVMLMIDRDGYATTMLSDNFAEWLTNVLDKVDAGISS